MRTNVNYGKFTSLVLIILFVALLFTACTTRDRYQYEIGESNLNAHDRSNLQASNEEQAYGYTNKVTKHHDNKKMHLSLDTGSKVSDIQGIHIAHVVVTDQNAYVAIVLNQSATGTLESGTPHSSIGGTGDGTPFYKDGELKTETDAPFTTPDERNVSAKLKQKIALKVRELNPHVAEVFISANDEWNKLFGRYLRLQWSGKSLDSYVDELNEAVQKYFPHP